MKIDKKLIKELVDCLGEFNITEIEYQDGDKKIKVSKTQKNISEQGNLCAFIQQIIRGKNYQECGTDRSRIH